VALYGCFGTFPLGSNGSVRINETEKTEGWIAGRVEGQVEV
jgi:hypothetical protein